MKTLKRRAVTLAVVLFVMLAIAAVLALIPKARAEIQCVAREDAESMLLDNHGERKVSQGVTASGGILAVFVNPKTRAWSLVAIIPDPPQACLISGGEGWERFDYAEAATTEDGSIWDAD